MTLKSPLGLFEQSNGVCEVPFLAAHLGLQQEGLHGRSDLIDLAAEARGLSVMARAEMGAGRQRRHPQLIAMACGQILVRPGCERPIAVRLRLPRLPQ